MEGRVFLSHASEEHELVEHIAGYIERNGLKAWYAPRDITGGFDYDLEILDAIRNCRAFVLLLSRNSDASEDVKTEVYHAVKYKKQLICLDVEDVEPEKLSYLLGTRHRLNWLARRDETLDTLIRDINRASASHHHEQSEPHEPSRPKPPLQPHEPLRPREPAQPTAPLQPHEPSQPRKPAQPKAPAQPQEPSQPREPSLPHEPSQPREPSQPPVPSKPNRTFTGAYIAIAAFVILSLLVLIGVMHTDTPSQTPVNTMEPARVFYIAGKGTPEEIRKAAKEGADFAITTDALPEGMSSMDRAMTTLFLAVNTNTAEAVRAIAESGVNVNAVGSANGLTALMQASGQGKIDTVKVLIDAGADVNIQSVHGWTALIVAAATNNPDIVSLLLNHGADKNIRDNEGKTAYDHALEQEHFDLLPLLKPDE